MAPLIMPASPRFQDFSFQLIPNTVDHVSVLDGSADTVAFPGSRWRLRATLPPMREHEGGEAWAAFIAELEGRAGRFYAGDGRRIVPRGLATTIPAHQNDIPNNTMQGAMVGTVGSGGAVPTGWNFGNPTSSYTLVVDAIGVDGGVDYIDLTFTGTNTSGSAEFPLLSFVGNEVVPSMTGQDWTASAWGKHFGATPSHAANLSMASRDIGGAQLQSSSMDLAQSTVFTRREASLNFSLVGSAYAQTRVIFNVPDTESLSASFRLGLPQQEQLVAASTAIRTSGTARSRPAGPFIEGAGQAGRAIKLGGWQPSSSGLLLIGDYIAYDTPAGNRRLHKLTADLPDSDIAGEAIAAIRPPIREAPADGAAVLISPAQAVMHLVSDDQGEPLVDRAGFYRIAFEAEEIFES